MTNPSFPTPALDALESGRKDDQHKIRPTLVLGSMSHAIVEVVKLGTFGAEKYDDDNWKTVEDKEKRYEDALLRHYLAWKTAEDYDQETGCHHLASIAWNALALLEIEICKTYEDSQ